MPSLSLHLCLTPQCATLLLQLGESVVPSEDSAQFKRAHALLRLTEVTRLQAALERAVGEYAVLRGERRAAGAAGKDSRSLQRKRKARSKRVRSILAELGVWRQVPGLPSVDGDEVVMCLPLAGWEDDAMQGLYEGQFPWREGDGGVALAVLAEKYRDAKAEVSGVWGCRGCPCIAACFAASLCANPLCPCACSWTAPTKRSSCNGGSAGRRCATCPTCKRSWQASLLPSVLRPRPARQVPRM